MAMQMGRTRGCFTYNRARGISKVKRPEGLCGVRIRLTVLEPQVVGLLTFETAEGVECPPPEGVIVVRVVTPVERIRYAGVQLPAEEVIDAVGNVRAVLPQHTYEVRLHGVAVFTLHSSLEHKLMDNIAGGGTADPALPDENDAQEDSDAEGEP